MVPRSRSVRREHRTSPLLQLRLWHLALLVLFVAVATVDIRSLRRSELALVVAAAVGYAGFGLLCWAGWHWIGRLRSRLSPVLVFGLYAFTMAGIYWGAVTVYLGLESAYLSGRLF